MEKGELFPTNDGGTIGHLYVKRLNREQNLTPGTKINHRAKCVQL